MCITAWSAIRNTLTISLNDFKSSVTGFAPSLRYMRKIVPIVIFNIVYNRFKLEENLFVKNTIKDWEYKTFNTKIKHPTICKVYYWTKSIAEAIKTSTVEKIYMIFTNKENNHPIEHFIFNLESVESVPETIVKSTAIFQQTKQLFNLVNSLSDYVKLDDDEIEIIFEIKFEEGKNNLNIPYFQRWASQPLYKKINTFPLFPLGKMNTGHHSFTLAFHQNDIIEEKNDKNSIAASDNAECNEEPSQISKSIMNSFSYETPEISLMNLSLNSSGRSKRKRSRSPSLESIKRLIDEEIELKNGGVDFSNKKFCSDRSHSLVNSTHDTSISNIEDPLTPSSHQVNQNNDINCFCDIKQSFENIETVACSICSGKKHSVCVGYKYSANLPNYFICLKCGSKKRPATDVKFAYMPFREVRLMSKKRLVLWHCMVNKKYPEELMHLWDSRTQSDIRKFVAKVPDMTMDAKGNTVTVFESPKFIQFMTFLFHDVVNITDENPQSLTL